MELYITRKEEINDPEYGVGTWGEFAIEDQIAAYTMEDGFHPVLEKVNGKTRIPSGRFPVRKRKVLSKMTKQYRNKKALKGIFDWHLEICDVPYFTNVYIHIGNWPKDTDGCVLVGDEHVEGRSMITNSTNTYIKIYQLISAALERDEEVWININ